MNFSKRFGSLTPNNTNLIILKGYFMFIYLIIGKI